MEREFKWFEVGFIGWIIMWFLVESLLFKLIWNKWFKEFYVFVIGFGILSILIKKSVIIKKKIIKKKIKINKKVVKWKLKF